MIYYLEDVRKVYNLPLPTLIYYAQEIHQQTQVPDAVQINMLQSIKTGACSEDCAYCPQSARANTGLKPEPLMDSEAVVAAAKKAKAAGASRFCMGAAWRKVNDGPQFESVLASVRGVKALGLQVCCTLGLITEAQAARLKEAGCDIYNHNLDTSREYYPEIISTRTYDDRLTTIRNVQAAGMGVCSGGILGMGETVDDRLKMLIELANMETPPESVPINALIPCPGTPLEGRPRVDIFEFVRIIAVARILMPKAIIRISAGRAQMTDEGQALCFAAGANSIFLGDKLLTTPNGPASKDFALLAKLGLRPLDPEEFRRKMMGCKGDGSCGKCDGSCGHDHSHDHHHEHAHGNATEVREEATPVPAAPALTPAEEERSPSAVVPTAPALAAPSSEDEGVPEFAKKHAHELDENGTWARGCNCDDH